MERIKKFIKDNYLYLILLLITIILVYILRSKTSLAGIIDDYIYKLVINTKSDGVTLFFRIISYLAEPITLIILSIILLIVIKDKRDKYYLCFNLILSTVLAHVIKYMFLRPRPLEGIITEYGYSFPSAHSLVGLCFYSFLIYLVHKSNLKCKKIIYFVFGLIIILIGISRIYLGVHFATDVVGGYVIGFLYLCIFIRTISSDKKELDKE